MNRQHIFSTLIILAISAFSFTAAAQNKELASDMFASMKGTDKAAIVAVHFGTSNDNARVASIDRFNESLRQAFPNYDFREAWTSTIIINKIKGNGIIRQTPSEVMEQLKLEGFTHVLVQSSNIIEGTEMEYLRTSLAKYKNDFKQFRISTPLLHDVEDYEWALDAESKFIKDKKTMTVLVCHGTSGAGNSHYTMLDYVIRDKGYNNFMVATIEGYPSFESLVKNLKAQKIKKVNLVPFMFVAGEHAQNDIAVEWKKSLETEGIKAKPILKSIGENNEMISIFIKHAKHTQNYHIYNATERKMQKKALQ